MKKHIFIAAAVAILCSTSCSAPTEPPQGQDNTTPTTSAASEPIEMPGLWIDAAAFKTFDNRIEQMSSDDGDAHMLIFLKPGDIGGMGEIATTIRNVSTAMHNGATDLKDQRSLTIRAVADSGEDLGTITIPVAALKKADYKTLNHADALDLASGTALSTSGETAARTFCQERRQEAKQFCQPF